MNKILKDKLVNSLALYSQKRYLAADDLYKSYLNDIVLIDNKKNGNDIIIELEITDSDLVEILEYEEQHRKEFDRLLKRTAKVREILESMPPIVEHEVEHDVQSHHHVKQMLR